MSDTLSDEDRQMIDEAVAKGKVRRIPYGVRTITISDTVYDERLGKLRYADKDLAKRRLKNGTKWGRGK